MLKSNPPKSVIKTVMNAIKQFGTGDLSMEERFAQLGYRAAPPAPAEALPCPKEQKAARDALYREQGIPAADGTIVLPMERAGAELNVPKDLFFTAVEQGWTPAEVVSVKRVKTKAKRGYWDKHFGVT